MTFSVNLPSGQAIAVPSADTVGGLGRAFMKLITPDGHLLDDSMKSLDEFAGLGDGNQITAIKLLPKVPRSPALSVLSVHGQRAVRDA